MYKTNTEELNFYHQDQANQIPIVCHYDETTLLTKNSDLIQIIKVKGLQSTVQDQGVSNLREKVRKVIKDNLKSDSIAIQLHVVRDYQDIMPKRYNGSIEIVGQLEDAWCRENTWDRKLVNTMYISVIKKGVRLNYFNFQDFFLSIIPLALKQKYKNFFHDACQELTAVTSSIAHAIESFGSKVLTIIEKDNLLYSEPLAFYHYLINLVYEDMPLKRYDFSKLLANFKLKNDYQCMQLVSDKYKQKFVSVYTFKTIMAADENFFDDILQFKANFVLSEFITIAPKDKALSRVNEYVKMLKSVKNTDLIESFNLDLFINEDLNQLNDYCTSQLNITYFADSLEGMVDITRKIAAIYANKGIKTIKEDINTASVFFHNLPGNFTLTNRAYYTATNFAASLCNIHTKDMGVCQGSKWGEPITIFNTIQDSYYFFNFHYKNNGNTVIIGPDGAGKKTLLHFLLYQSIKLDVKIIYIDVINRSKRFIESLGGKYNKCQLNEPSSIKINLFDIENYGGNNEIMATVLLKVCAGNDSSRLFNKEYQAKFLEIIPLLKDLKTFKERFDAFEKFINKFNDTTIKTNFKHFFKSEYFSNFFAEEQTGDDFFQNYMSIDLSDIIKNKIFFDIYIGILLSYLVNNIAQEKTIIALNSAHNIFLDNIFSEQISGWLQKLNEKNGLLLLTKENTNNEKVNARLQKNLQFFGSRIFMSDRQMSKDFKLSLNLSNEEFYFLKGHEKQRRRFLIKYEDNSFMTEMNLATVKDVLSFLD